MASLRRRYQPDSRAAFMEVILLPFPSQSQGQCLRGAANKLRSCGIAMVALPSATHRNFDISARVHISEPKQSLLYQPRGHICERPCAERDDFRQPPAESCAGRQVVRQVLLDTRRRWELIYIARNWFSRNERLSQNFPLSRLLLPCIYSYKLRVRNVITRIFVAGRVVCT